VSVKSSKREEEREMTSVDVQHASVKLGDFNLQDINLNVKTKEFFVILGPSGAGKTVLLDLIAGFSYPSTGKVFIDSEDVTFMPTEKRRVGYMFQDFALFPNMSVYKNIKFGTKYYKILNAESRILELMEMLEIVPLKDRRTTTLSSGEKQRVALARSLILEPRLLLLDEPLSSLDARAKETVRDELKEIIGNVGITTLYVTHDQAEAIVLADRIGIMHNGRLIQTGSSDQVFNHPKDEFIARFVGMENMFQGVVTSNDDGLISVDVGNTIIEAVFDVAVGSEVILGIRPENITLQVGETISSARNVFNGNVKQIVPLGPISKIKIDCGLTLSAFITKRSSEFLNLSKDTEIIASFKASNVYVIQKGN
jgi:molybdate/tungstate transport system ATP-binding protein